MLDDECIQAIDSKQVGVGQLFRYLRALPSFTLIQASRVQQQLLQRPHIDSNNNSRDNSTSSSSGSSGSVFYLIRHYKLECPQVKCEFIETFESDFLDIATTTANTNTTDVHI